MPDYYSLDEVATRLGKTEAEVKDLVAKGELRAFRDAGTLKFKKVEVDAKAPAGPPAGKDVEVEAETAAEPKQDELLFLIDEEGTPGDADDLTLIGETEEATESAGKGAGEVLEDEALTAVMKTPEGVAGPEPAAGEPDIFAEAQAEVEPAEAEVAAVAGAATMRAKRLAEIQRAAQSRHDRAAHRRVCRPGLDRDYRVQHVRDRAAARIH